MIHSEAMLALFAFLLLGFSCKTPLGGHFFCPLFSEIIVARFGSFKSWKQSSTLICKSFAASKQFSNSTWYFANNGLVAWKSLNIFFKIWISTCVLWFQTDNAFGKCEHSFMEQGHTLRTNFGEVFHRNVLTELMSRELSYIILWMKHEGKTFRLSLTENNFSCLRSLAGKAASANDDVLIYLLLYQYVAKLYRFVRLIWRIIEKLHVFLHL